jgi:hypothetical protein
MILSGEGGPLRRIGRGGRRVEAPDGSSISGETYLRAATATRSKLPQLVQAMVGNPFVTVQSAQLATGLSAPGARNLVRKAEDLGWLKSIGTHGRGGREHWYARELFQIIEAPMRYAPE